MKTHACLTLIGLLLTSLISCKKSSAPNSALNKPTPPPIDTSATGTKHDTLITDVYVAGSIASISAKTGHAQLWKNGVGTALSNVPSTGLHVVVSNGNTYVCGNEGVLVDNRRAVYWKNFGYSTPLTDGNDDSSVANDIALQDSDILCVGNVSYKAGEKAVFWRNRQMTTLASNATATRILIKGNDIYITGSYTGEDGNVIACYWKNGIIHSLNTNAEASGIAIDDNSNIYVCGSTHNATPVYWKNDVMTVLAKTTKWAYANSIVIKGNDFYIVGTGIDDFYVGYDQAYYWKNGEPQYFSGASGVNDIAIVGNNTFMTGMKIFYSHGPGYARLWENTTIAYLVSDMPATFNGLYIDQHY